MSKRVEWVEWVVRFDINSVPYEKVFGNECDAVTHAVWVDANEGLYPVVFQRTITETPVKRKGRK